MTQRRKFLLSIYCFDATEGRINSTQLLSLLFFHFNQVKAYPPIPTYFDPLMMMVPLIVVAYDSDVSVHGPLSQVKKPTD